MIIPVTPSLIESARSRAASAAASWSPKVTSGRLNPDALFIGALGEIGWSEGHPDHVYLVEGNLDFDAVSSTGETLEIKTRTISVPPSTVDLEHRIPVRQRHQSCGWYLFTCVEFSGGSPVNIHLLGWITKVRFWSTAVILRDGELNGNMIVRGDSAFIRTSLLDSEA